MKSADASATKLKSVLKKFGGGEAVLPAGVPELDQDDPIAVLVFSFLLWESTSSLAVDAMKKVVASTVDFNDLRVCLPNEVVAIIGTRYPRALERARLLKRALHSIYLDRHAVSLEHLQQGGKREAKAYVEELDGIPPYVAARVLLLSFDVHAIPADEMLVEGLGGKGVFKGEVEVEDASSWLTRQVKSSDARATELALRTFGDTLTPKRNPPPRKVATPEPAPVEPAPEPEVPAAASGKKTSKASAKPAKKPASKKTTPKKTTSKKTTTSKAATGKSATKKAAARKSTSKKAPAKKAPAKKSAAKKSQAKKSVAKKSAAKKTAKKSPARKTTKKSASRK